MRRLILLALLALLCAPGAFAQSTGGDFVKYYPPGGIVNGTPIQPSSVIVRSSATGTPIIFEAPASSTVTGTGNLFIGTGAGASVTTGTNNIAIGTSATTGGAAVTNCLAIGTNAECNGISNSFAIGHYSTEFTHGYINGANGVNGTPRGNFVLHGAGGASGVNVASGSFTIAGGQSTGNVAGGSVIIATAPAVGSGSTQGTLVDRVTITTTGTNVTMGTGTATANVGGVLNVNTTTQATTGTSEEVLATYTLPANTLSANGKLIRITAWGTFAANANSKTTRVRFGGLAGTIISGVTTTSNNGNWRHVTEVVRTGAATQASSGVVTYGVTAGAGALAPTVGAPTQTLSGTVDIAVTGTSPTTIGDVSFSGLIVEALN
jgi:hypothetical protein